MPEDAAGEATSVRTCPWPNDPRLICIVCTGTMIQVHGHLQCPACGYVEPCCW